MMIDLLFAVDYRSNILSLCSSMGNLSRSSTIKPSPHSNLCLTILFCVLSMYALLTSLTTLYIFCVLSMYTLLTTLYIILCAFNVYTTHYSLYYSVCFQCIHYSLLSILFCVLSMYTLLTTLYIILCAFNVYTTHYSLYYSVCFQCLYYSVCFRHIYLTRTSMFLLDKKG